MTGPQATAFGAARYGTGAAVIAGGSGGIGRAIARTLVDAGSRVVLTWHRNREPAERLAEELGGPEVAAAQQLDLRASETVAAVHAAAGERFGGVHTAVYAAGPYIDMRYISGLAPDLFERTVGSDVFGAYNFLHHALPGLRATRGVAICLGTPAIRRYSKKDVLSSAPKAALEQVVRGIAAEEGRHGVRANMVGVGVIDDGMFHELMARGDFDQKFIDNTRRAVALGRLGSALDIARAVAFLASDSAAYITGQTLMVDGGYVL